MQTSMVSSTLEVNAIIGSSYDRQSELKAFDDSKLGVKGLVDKINHGIPKSVLDEMIDGVQGFHEIESEEKSKYYSRDYQKRDIITEYSNHIMKLGLTLLELFSEALGLEQNHLESLGCAQGLYLLGHYYPHCPQPDLTSLRMINSKVSIIEYWRRKEVRGYQLQPSSGRFMRGLSQ
ncbi:hypothetical protein L6452_32853 [Arctium lappa]|uniref:Uncharacterized protein n=1 Tax=Arctium lappa TaxID=4217 RepID=A0ACB8Z6N2_ARCLA|nr:hypothetical protein L6452_32853 [Arctium lappa]